MSSLKEKILSDVKEAMKAKAQLKLSTLRFLNAQIKNKEIELRPESISDEGVISVIKKSVKQRKDSIEQYENAGRQNLADTEKAELDILESYLPEMMSEDQIKIFVDEAIKESGATDMKDMGRVMKLVMTKTQGQADNKVISQFVKQSLS